MLSFYTFQEILYKEKIYNEQNIPIRDLNEQEVQIIHEILEHGNSAEIKPGKDGNIIILEVKRKPTDRSQ